MYSTAVLSVISRTCGPPCHAASSAIQLQSRVQFRQRVIRRRIRYVQLEVSDYFLSTTTYFLALILNLNPSVAYAQLTGHIERGAAANKGCGDETKLFSISLAHPPPTLFHSQTFLFLSVYISLFLTSPSH